MLGPMSGPHQRIKRIASLCAGAFGAVNGVFNRLSNSYFDSTRPISPEALMSVRISFAVFAGAIAVAAFCAGVWTRVTHVLTTLLGAITLVAGYAAFTHGLTDVLGVTLLIAGVLLLVLSWQSYFHRSRPAWAFLIAICGVFAVAELFGAPKVTRGLDISLWLTMILPGLNVVAVFGLVSLRDEYIERGPVTA